MKVSYSYLPRQFSDIDDLLDDIKKYRTFDDNFIDKEYYVFSEILVDGESINTVFKFFYSF